MTTDELNIIISADTGNAAQNIGNTADELNRLGETAQNADGDMSALVKAMSEAAAQMVAVSQNIAASASGVSGFQGSFEALNVTLQGISGQFDTLNATIQAMSFGDAAARVADLSVASEQSANALNGISTAADDFAQHMTTLSDATKGTADGMDALTSEFSTALASIKNFSSDMSAAGQEAQETAQKIKDLAEQVNKIPKGSNVTDLTKSFRTLKGVIATLGIGAFIKDSQAAYETQMTNELKLTSHMKHRMQATDDEIASIKELASTQQKLGVIGDEIQLAGAQQLTTYARQSSTLKTLIPAMNNLIAQQAGYEASTGDAISAADMLGRALGGQYTMLRRMGITFTEAQENVLKYGTETQKAAVLADAINAKVGNMNQLLAQTPTGQLKQLQNELGDFQEELAATWQPLISSFLPVLRGLFDAIKQPIKDVAAGITVIGQAIAKVDSPAVRAIALTAAGIAVVNKLSLAVGSASAGILVAGVLLTGLIGAMQKDQQSIGDIVNDAYTSAADATNQATDAASDYKDELGEVQKAAARLAGFDTITKLSGSGSQGSLVNALIGETGLEDIQDFTDAVKEAANAENALADMQLPEIDFGSIIQGGLDISKDFWSLIFGDDEKKYDILKKWTAGIEEVFGSDWTQYWQKVGGAIYDIFSGDDSKAYQGWQVLNGNIKDLFGEDFTSFWNEVGSNIYDIVNGDEYGALKGWRNIADNVIGNIFGSDFVHHFETMGADIYNALHRGGELHQSKFDKEPITDYFPDALHGGGLSVEYQNANNNVIKNHYQTDRYDVPTVPTTISSSETPMQATIIMDGEVIGTAAMRLQEAQSLISNGIY